jgi:PIN domain nuclease of toxin-antitoxin system
LGDVAVLLLDTHIWVWYDVEVMTVDRRILKYDHVRTVGNA